MYEVYSDYSLGSSICQFLIGRNRQNKKASSHSLLDTRVNCLSLRDSLIYLILGMDRPRCSPLAGKGVPL